LKLIRPLPRALTRSLSLLVLAAWALNMGALVHRTRASGVALGADLARYGSSAQWRGIYYRGDKIGFSVGQTRPHGEGYEIREDGRLQMTLLGSPTAVRLTSVVEVDRAFNLRRFRFSLDPGTGATEVSGDLDGRRLRIAPRSATCPSRRRSRLTSRARSPRAASGRVRPTTCRSSTLPRSTTRP